MAVSTYRLDGQKVKIDDSKYSGCLADYTHNYWQIPHSFVGFHSTLLCSGMFRIMAIWVVEFSNGGYKIRKIFAKEKEIIEFWELD